MLKGAKVVSATGSKRIVAMRPGAVVPSAQPKQVSRQELLKRLDSVRAGNTLGEAIAAVGTPASTIAMSDDAGALVERMRFRVSGADVGVIEVRDGVVTSVAQIGH